MPDTCKNPGNCYVIVVEDDPTLKIVLAMQLMSVDINFCAASNGYQALDLIKSHHPKVLLLDVSIPGLSGFALVEKMRQDPTLTDLSDMHVVVHTSHDLSLDEQQQLSFGQPQFLTKTKVTEDLPALVQRLLLDRQT